MLTPVPRVKSTLRAIPVLRATLTAVPRAQPMPAPRATQPLIPAARPLIPAARAAVLLLLQAASEPSSRAIPVDDEAASEPLGKAVQEKAKVALAPAKSAPAPTNSAAKPALEEAVTDPVTVAIPGRAKCLVEVKVESVTLSDTRPTGPDDGSSECKLALYYMCWGVRSHPSRGGGVLSRLSS